MKKNNKDMLSAILLLSLCTFCFVGCEKKEKEIVKESSSLTEDVNKILDGKSSVKKGEFTFTEPKVKTIPEEALPSESIKTIKLYLGENVYYPIDIPQDLEIVTDYSKYIYAKDNSFSASVVSNVPWDDFSKFVSIRNPVQEQPDLITSEPKKKGPQEAAKHIANDKAVIIRTYNNPTVYATVYSGLLKNTYKVTPHTSLVTKKGKTKILEDLPLYTGYHASITVGMDKDIQKIYNFDDGSVTIARELKKWEDSKNLLNVKAAVVSENYVAEKQYTSDKIYYAECGNFTIGAQSVNYNTTITLFGYGEEARFNIIAFLKSS